MINSPVVLITVGGQRCLRSAWRSATTLICVVAPGSGEHLDVHVVIDGESSLFFLLNCMSGFFTLIYSLNLMIVAGVVATVGSGAAAAAAASALSFSYGAPAVHTIVPQHGSPRGGACTQANVLFLYVHDF